ncbi:MAG: hypothetical protein C0434_05615 [Xanthomonadaceae bacterium]|nr:hypothetical protein [Xanthomonadaceae bacterium]
MGAGQGAGPQWLGHVQNPPGAGLIVGSARSMLDASLGVNPSLTITALTARATSPIPRKPACVAAT